MGQAGVHHVAPVDELVEHLGDIGMVHRPADAVAGQILLADIGDVVGIVAFREEVVVGLVPLGPDILRDGFVPFLAVGEGGIDVEHHAAKVEHLVAHHVADAESRKAPQGHFDVAPGLMGEKLRDLHWNQDRWPGAPVQWAVKMRHCDRMCRRVLAGASH